MAGKTALELVNKLFGKTSKIQLNQEGGIFGTTSLQGNLLEMNKNIASLSQAIASNMLYSEIMEKHELVVSNLDAAGLMGIISQSEISDYYKIVDEIWLAIENEKASFGKDVSS